MTAISAFEGGIKVIADHLAKQRQRSVNEEGRCRYRGVGETACAVGCLFSDENYDRTMEGKGAGAFANQRSKSAMAEIQGHFPEVPQDQTLSFLRSVQRYHDGPRSVQHNYVHHLDTHADMSNAQLAYTIRRHLTKLAQRTVQ